MTKLRFLHIPKTAGSSFGECLFIQYFQAYALRRIFTLTGNIALDSQRYARLSPAQRRRIALYVGHGPRTTGYREIDTLPTMTLLRDPVQRVVSLCQHISEGKSPRWSTGTDPTTMNLDAFLAQGGARVSNLQTRILLGRQSYQLPKGQDSDLAQRALDVLQNDLACFGLTEEFDGSLLLFQKVLGWKNPPIYRNRNTRDERLVVPLQERHLEQIRALNAIDIRLYEMAKPLFQRRLAELIPDTTAALERFQIEIDKPRAIFRLFDTGRSLKRLSRRFDSPPS